MTNQTVIESSCHQKSKAPLQMRVQGATRKAHMFFRVDNKMQWLLAYFDKPGLIILNTLLETSYY